MLLLLLLSRFSRVRLCATPEMAAHQAPPSLGFSRQEHWSVLPFPSPMHESEKWKWSHSVVSDSSQPHGLQPSRLLRPWDFPGKSTGVGCHRPLRRDSIHNILFYKYEVERPMVLILHILRMPCWVNYYTFIPFRKFQILYSQTMVHLELLTLIYSQKGNSQTMTVNATLKYRLGNWMLRKLVPISFYSFHNPQ